MWVENSGFQPFSIHQDHLKGLLKKRGVGSSKFSNSVRLEQILRFCISNKFPGVADAYLENTEVGPTCFLVISRTGHMRATTKFQRPHLHLVRPMGLLIILPLSSLPTISCNRPQEPLKIA